MKPFFQYCAYCGLRLPLTELKIEQDSGFLMCRDDLGCYNRANGENAAYIAALEMRLAAVEKERTALIIKIGEERKSRGMPDRVLEEHKAEMARIEAGE